MPSTTNRKRSLQPARPLRQASDVQTVIVDGQVLMRDRQLQLVEERKALEEAKKANLDLMARLNALSF